SGRLRAGQRDYRRSRGLSLVAGACHAALGCYLPLPGGAALERAGPIGGVGRDWAPCLRDRVGSARPAGRDALMTSGNPLHGRPTAAELIAAVAEFIEGDVR